MQASLAFLPGTLPASPLSSQRKAVLEADSAWEILPAGGGDGTSGVLVGKSTPDPLPVFIIPHSSRAVAANICTKVTGSDCFKTKSRGPEAGELL